MRSIERLSGDRRGVAAVEFALVLPILVLLYFGMTEAASLYTVDRRVTTVAGTLGDLVSRIDGTITPARLSDFFDASRTIMKPHPTAALKQVVSVLKVTSAGVATVCWSRASGTGATARTATSTYPLDASTQINQLARGSFLVVSEVSYPYVPLYGVVISATINLAHTDYYLPRYAAYIGITGTTTCPS